MCAAQEKTLKGEAGFDAYYARQFKERWPSLRTALLKNARYVPIPAKVGGAKEYFLDAASVSAALALPTAGCKRVLDMCAAPGGKSLVLAHKILEEARSHAAEGAQIENLLPEQFICNEVSGARRSRLAAVLDTYVDPVMRSRIAITGFDGAKWCLYERESFDAVLLDAPCSSERHVLQDPKYLAQWSPSRIKHTAHTQWALLSSAFRLLKTGGHVLYATCALSVQENDGTVKKLLGKFENAHLVPVNIPQKFFSCVLPACGKREKTECGFHILPDAHEGAGPLYFSLIQKADPPLT